MTASPEHSRAYRLVEARYRRLLGLPPASLTSRRHRRRKSAAFASSDRGCCTTLFDTSNLAKLGKIFVAKAPISSATGFRILYLSNVSREERVGYVHSWFKIT